MDPALKKKTISQPHDVKLNYYNEFNINSPIFDNFRSGCAENRKTYNWHVFYKPILEIIQCKCMTGQCEEKCRSVWRKLERIIDNIELECCICDCEKLQNYDNLHDKIKCAIAFFNRKVDLAQYFNIFDDEI